MKQLISMKGKRLGCWCYPDACHGDVLLELIDMYTKPSTTKPSTTQPSIIKDIARILGELKSSLGFSLLVAEQALNFALEISDRFVIIEKGEIVHQATRLDMNESEIRSYLTI